MKPDELLMPSPAWRLKEIVGSNMVIYRYATYRTNEELMIWLLDDGKYVAQLTGTEGKEVTNRLSQARWAELYSKAIAAKTLLGKMPSSMIEEIF